MIPSWLSQACKRWWRPVAWALGSLFLLASVAWGILLYQILPRIDEWRDALAQQATRALGVPVQIGRVAGRPEGLWPVLSLSEVRLLDERGQVALRLPEVSVRISPSSFLPQALWQQEWRLDRLIVVAPELDVRRDREGVLHVAGLRVDVSGKAAKGASDTAADWLLSQHLIRIDRGQIRWTDELRGAPTIGLQDVNLALSNRPGFGRRWHELKLEATPPAEFGRRGLIQVSMTQPLWQVGEVLIPEGASVPWWRRLVGAAPRPSQWQSWSGTVRLDLPWVDVQQLRRHLTLPIEVNGGRGRVGLDLALYQGKWQGLSLDADVQDVSVRLARELAPLSFRQVAGRVSMTHEPEVTVLQYQNLRFVTAEGVVWPSSSASLQWRHAKWDGVTLNDQVWQLTKGGVFEAERLDLALLAQLADRLPLSRRVRQALNDLAPQGIGDDLRWQWEGPLDAPTTYRTKGRFSGLTWSGSREAGWPGLSQANVRFQADESGGRADLEVERGWIEFPDVFEEPRIPLTSLNSVVRWDIRRSRVAGQAPDIDLYVKQAQFANPDAQGELEGHWQTGGRADAPQVARLPGRLELQGKLSRGQANRVWRYLPSVLPASARYYVRDALKSGQGEKVRFQVEGDLNQFPFKDDVGGKFRVYVPVKQLTLDYVPEVRQAGQPYWPAFSQLDGELVFEGQRLRIERAQARLGEVGTGGFVLHNVSGLIDDLGADNPHLVIKGQGEGPLDDVLKYLSTSPVGQWTGNMMSVAHGSGQSALQLALDIPLDQVEHTTLKGRVTMKASDQAALRLTPALPLFDALVGEIGFTESALTVKAQTRVWGQDVGVEGQRDASGTTQFLARGVMTAEGLQRAQDWPLLAQLGKHLTGQSPFTVSVSIPKVATPEAPAGLPIVEVQSSLQGFASSLPAPLNKAASSVWPLKVTYRLDDAQGHNDALVVDVANPQAPGMSEGAPWLKVDLRRDVTGAEAKVRRGLISLMQLSAGAAQAVPVLPAKGVSLQVVVPALDLDAWQAVGKSFQLGGEGASAESSSGYVPDTISVTTGTLAYQQRTLRDVSATVAHPAAGVWRAQLDARQISGQIEWLPDTANGGNATQSGSRLVARLTRLSIPAAEAQALQEQATERMLSTDKAGQDVPALDIVVDQFDWRGVSLGRLEVEAVNHMVSGAAGAVVPEWRLTRFKLGAPEAQLNATGAWSAVPGTRMRPRSSFDFTLDVNNLGDTLTRLGLPRTVRGGKGKVSGRVSWQGSPLEPDVETLSGDLNVVVNEGQFLKVDPGMAKLLGVLSLQSLPRRLTLDFRDVFQQGFAFDAIDGQVRIQQGVAETRNLRMRGVQAVVLMEGQADLVKETQNLHVYVVPDVNAVGASLAYAAINPVVGLGTFLAQVLLRKSVSEASTQEFLVTGPWADPQVEKLSARTAVPLAASAPSAPALPPAAAASRLKEGQ
ncbi:YhdP family protein [Aquabacterium sp.]|uniref:YhdP family protein n=1 Tax=Aquabacterium sp. TaxID=1872578 RepID=UPI002E2F60B9|nr:YhdP family protein [Aquabacterium sp.]HEX5310274.1 YhdP family protein [Aquabacterium sp.]